jgi:hypothetical protein
MQAREPRTCALLLAAEGRVEQCPGETCAFWEPGGAVLEGGCVIDRLGLDVRHVEPASYLLELRRRLEAADDWENP